MRSKLLTALAALSTVGVMGQSFTIAEPLINTCQASFQDTGGEPGGGYSDNENLTSTICPDAPGLAISLDFSATPFTLSSDGTAPLDQLTIYDGDNTSAPPLGTWTGTDSPGIVSASVSNISGCLTVSFTSNETGTGRFAAFVSCAIPCDHPTASATMSAGTVLPVLACQGEEITFNGLASTAAGSASIVEYLWDFDDGTQDSLSGVEAMHSFSAPGEYIVQLYVTDNNNCTNLNRVDLQILISTTPTFSATLIADTALCQGAELVLNATGTEPTTWSAAPIVDFGDGIYIPDDQSQPFVSEITYTGFSPNATLTDIGDLLSVCVSMEHSYMGDLVMFLTCPNGQSVTFHQQGGTNTFIGDALDLGEGPGTCLTYCWDPMATNGTFVDNSTNGTTPNVQPATVTPGSSVLIPGTYESVQPMDQLLGCPLNGTWFFTWNDLLGADDGYVCSWEVNFDPSLYPDLTEYTPDLGLSTSDSSTWSGPNVVLDPQNPLYAVASLTEAGAFEYVFSVTDNFGCTYDTTMVVIVAPSPQSPVLITGDAVLCDGSIASLSAPAGFTSYDWSNGFVGQNINVIEGTYTVTVAYDECELESEPFIVALAPSPQPVITGPQFSCGGAPATLGTTESYASYQWSNSSTDPTITVGTGNYNVSVTNAEGCTALSPSFSVTVGSDPQANFAPNPPSPQGIGADVDFNDASTGNGSPITSWAWDFGIVGEGSTEPSPSFTFTTPGTYQVSLTVTAADGCESTTTYPYVIIPEEIIIPNVFTPNGDANNEYFVIENGQYYRNTLAIYNRWGQIVFDSNNYQNTWRGADVPDGTYYYVFTTADNGKEYNGHVTILR